MNSGTGLSLRIGKYQRGLENQLEIMRDQNFAQRLWDKDRDLFVKDKNPSAEVLMGWLNLPEKMMAALPEINDFCKSVRNAGFDHVVLLGMGGSSLAPLVFQKTVGESKNGLKLTVLDTTEPEMIKQIEASINLADTLFLVSSKSGNTAEVMAFYEYFYDRVSTIKPEKAGENFVAITDEGSPLVDISRIKNFRKTFINLPEIGGRYSALSYFGMVPAALMGINVKEILMRARKIAESWGGAVDVKENSAFVLGAAMGVMASKGCEKLTYLMPEELNSFGLWLEQLIAESTGKEGKGVMPFNGYPLSKKGSYAEDRFFVKYGFTGAQSDAELLQPLDSISVKHPFINIHIKDELDLGKEFFRWELATAVAGAVLELNPFDQPNVQESKKCTDTILKQIEKENRLPEMKPALIEDSLTYYYNEQKQNAKLLLEALLQTAGPGDYLTFQAYLPEQPAVEMYLSEMHRTIEAKYDIAVSTQFGPRYLHSTGQYHKGGPNNGYFIQLVCNSGVDIGIPGKSYTFGMLKRAQAIGDRQALMQHGRKVIMVDLGEDYVKGLNTLNQIMETLMVDVKERKYEEKPSEVTTSPEAMLLVQNQLNIDKPGAVSANI
jgi:glucose-6-phosphate isomerase